MKNSTPKRRAKQPAEIRFLTTGDSDRSFAVSHNNNIKRRIREGDDLSVANEEPRIGDLVIVTTGPDAFYSGFLALCDGMPCLHNDRGCTTHKPFFIVGKAYHSPAAQAEIIKLNKWKRERRRAS